MEFLDKRLDDYVCNFSADESDVLKELNRETHAKVLQPRMLSGHLQGRVLSMLSHMIKPKRILEIGTYTGYSAICLAEGLAEGGKIHTIDINEELQKMIEAYLDKASLSDKIQLHIGNALEIVPGLDEDWDLVFIDADKENYMNYYKMIAPKLKSGAYVIADNVLWSGKVIEDYNSLDEETKALVDYSKMVHEDPNMENVLFPIRDGLMIARKL
ncbi:MAG: methyltransferase [Flavobacteriales bacterium]|nr:methyltransferase [Flavobacteriales bacterium]